MTDTIPLPRELVERITEALEQYARYGSMDESVAAMLIELRSALTQQAEGAVPVAEAMGALIAAWNRLAKLHGWTRAWEPEPGDDGWIPAHEQMQRAINALISAQPSGEVLTESAMDDIELPPLPRMTHYGGTAVVLSAAELRARDAEVVRAALASAQPTEVCNVCGGVVLLTARPDTSAGKAIPSAQPAPTDAQIMATLDGLLVTGENQNYNGVYRYRSLGTPSHVTGPDLLEFARRVLALREVLVEVRAAEILRREAASIAECHTLGDGDWTGEEEAKAAHDEMLGVAAALSGPATAQATAESALYIGGPYHDGSMSVCELATGRIVHKFRLDGPSAPVGDGATQQAREDVPRNPQESRQHLLSRLQAEAERGITYDVTEADVLEFRRDAYGLTQTEFARVLGMQKLHYSEVIAGARRLPVNSITRAVSIGVPVGPLLADRKPLAAARAAQAGDGKAKGGA